VVRLLVSCGEHMRPVRRARPSPGRDGRPRNGRGSAPPPVEGRIEVVYPTAYSIVGILLTGALVVGVGIGIGLWLAVKAARPEALEREERTPADGP